jgi:hypothetical protein
MLKKSYIEVGGELLCGYSSGRSLDMIATRGSTVILKVKKTPSWWLEVA